MYLSKSICLSIYPYLNLSYSRNELDQLKHRLEMTDLELQKTNATLRRLGDEMRSYSQVYIYFYLLLKYAFT